MNTLQTAWLSAHPERSKEWLVERMRDWFDVHPIDGNPANLDPDNLILIEHDDHMRLRNHGLVNRVTANAIKFWEDVRSQEAEKERAAKAEAKAEARRAGDAALIQRQLMVNGLTDRSLPESGWLDDQLAQVMSDTQPQMLGPKLGFKVPS